MTQYFLKKNNRVPERLSFGCDGQPLHNPDKYGAAQLLLAASGTDVVVGGDQLDRVLLNRPAKPLATGLIYLALWAARVVYGSNLDTLLNQIVLGYALELGTGRPPAAPEGQSPEWLRLGENGQPVVEIDKYGAAQLLLAARNAELAECGPGCKPNCRAEFGSVHSLCAAECAAALDRIFQERPALPILSGLLHLGLAFCRQLYGPSCRAVLNQAVLAHAVNEGVNA